MSSSLHLSASLPLRGAAGRPRAAAGAGALHGPLRLHQRPPSAALRRHGVGHGRGGGKHQPGPAAAGALGRHGARLLHRLEIYTVSIIFSQSL